jgi:hypothetical protein
MSSYIPTGKHKYCTPFFSTCVPCMRNLRTQKGVNIMEFNWLILLAVAITTNASKTEENMF